MTEKYFWLEKDKLLSMENKAQLFYERISVSGQILNRTIQYFPLNQEDVFFMQGTTNILKDTRDFILKSLCM